MSDKTINPGRARGILRGLALLALILGAGYLLSSNIDIDQPWLFAAVAIGFVSCAPGLWRRSSR